MTSPSRRKRRITAPARTPPARTSARWLGVLTLLLGVGLASGRQPGQSTYQPQPLPALPLVSTLPSGLPPGPVVSSSVPAEAQWLAPASPAAQAPPQGGWAFPGPAARTE